MRIACLSYVFIDYTIQLANALSRNGIDVFLLLPVEHTEEHKEDLDSISRNVRRYFYNQPRYYSPINAILVFKLLRQLSAFNPDAVHIQGDNIWFSLILPCLRLRGYRVVSTLHDVKQHLGEERWRFIMHISRLLTVKYSERIFVHGRKMKEQLMVYYPANRICIIPMGEHNVTLLKKYARGLKEEKNLILFFGTIHQYKGLEYLIRAEPLITKEIPGAKIVIAGRAKAFEKYQQLMVNKENFIVHNHFIGSEQGAELFERCSLVVLPYVDASQSGVVPVAYAFKKPVVITDVGSLPEMVDDGKTGYVVMARSEEAMAKAVVSLLKDDPVRKQMGENGYQKLKRDLSWEKIAEKTIQVYREALVRMSKSGNSGTVVEQH